MSKLLNTYLSIFLAGCFAIAPIYSIQAQDLEAQMTASQTTQVDAKNIMAVVNNLVILRTFDSSVIWGINSRNSYIEAYDARTGERVWFHKDSGMIVSFVVFNNEIIIYRNYDYLTALDVQTGAVLWVHQTQGEYSTVIGE